MSIKKSKSNSLLTSSDAILTVRSKRHYLYMFLITFLLIVGSSVGVYAQTSPSGTPNNTSNDYGDNHRPDYNYLGLLGLLGLYGLHKIRTKSSTVVDRRVP